MLGSLFNRGQQGGNSSTGGQNVKTSLARFGSGGNRVGYSEFLGMGQPTTTYGYEGDVYVDVTPGAMSLYGHDGNRWVMWSGPSSSSHLSHPKDSNRWLWCNGQVFGWLPRSGRVIHNQGHSQTELLTSAISKKVNEPKKRKSYDAGAPDHLAAKKHKAAVREGSTAADSESHRSPSASVGPVSSATYSPMLPPPISAARSASVSEPASAHSHNFSSPLIPGERADLLREINDLRVASDLAQRQLTAANEQISQLKVDNDALRRELSVALSRILTDAGIPFSHLSSMASLDPGRLQPTPPLRAFSVEQSLDPDPPSSSRTRLLATIPTTQAGTSTLITGEEESNLIKQRALLEMKEFKDFIVHLKALGSKESHQINEGDDDDAMASEERNPANEGKQQSGDEGVGEELAGSDDEGADEEPVSADVVEEEPQAEGADSDTPYDEDDVDKDDVVKEDTRKDLNSEPDQDEVMEPVEGYGVDMDNELLLDDDTYNAGLSGQWDDFGEPAPEQNEGGATDTEEDQLFSPQADIDPQSEDYGDDNEAFVSSDYAKAEHVTSDTALDRLASDDSDNEDMDATERSASPGKPDIDRNVEEHRSIAVLEHTSGAGAQDSDEDGSDNLQLTINDEQSVHYAPIYNLDGTDSLPSAGAGSSDPKTGESRENVSQEPTALVDDIEDRAFMRDETQVAAETTAQLNSEDPLPQPGEGPVNQPQLESESLSVSLSQPPSWISRIPLPILFAKTKKYQLCRFCLTATPQIITKFPLALDLPAMEAHCNEKHDEYRAVLLDLSPQDFQGLLDADTSAQEA